MIRVEDHRPAIERVLGYYGLPAEALELVPSLGDWYRTQGVAEDRNALLARCWYAPHTGECRIVMHELFFQREFDEVNFAMEFRGFFDEVRKLSSMKHNLLHLLLREIACHTLRTRDEDLRDAWAFAEMPKHEI